MLVQGIQMGRLTLAQVLAQQEMLIVEIAESYRKRTLEQPDHDESMQVWFSFWLITVMILRKIFETIGSVVVC